MPRPSQKATKAKLQRNNAQSKFISPQYESDSASAYGSSENEISSDESITATCKLCAKQLPVQSNLIQVGNHQWPSHCFQNGWYHRQPGKRNRPVVYTGNSRATKFCHQAYWKKASAGCDSLHSFFQVRKEHSMAENPAWTDHGPASACTQIPFTRLAADVRWQKHSPGSGDGSCVSTGSGEWI